MGGYYHRPRARSVPYRLVYAHITGRELNLSHDEARLVRLPANDRVDLGDAAPCEHLEIVDQMNRVRIHPVLDYELGTPEFALHARVLLVVHVYEPRSFD